jgi:aspartyl-tRNA(Asn)/glutamyl-tRNA(Gln) amidotransferase subunit C
MPFVKSSELATISTSVSVRGISRLTISRIKCSHRLVFLREYQNVIPVAGQRLHKKKLMITVKDVKHVAKLARLSLTEDECIRFTEQLDNVIGYFDELNKVDTDGVEPMSHPIPVGNVLREDQVIRGATREQLMANAPVKEGSFFRVPRIGE